MVYVATSGDCDACLSAPGSSTFEAQFKVSDESGKPLPGAKVMLHRTHAPDAPVELSTGGEGTVRTPALTGPTLAVVMADGQLPEPVPVSWSDSGKQVLVRLHARKANRFAVHSGGDVMFGRRYSAPEWEEAGPQATPLIPLDDAAGGAEQVVSAIAPAFA